MDKRQNRPNQESEAVKNNESKSYVDSRLLDYERALIAQEHRLLPAIYNFLRSVFVLRGKERRLNIPPAATALFWCLVPSPSTATVGIVAILSLVVAWQQARLLSAQNEKIETQNVLAEAQRRSSLVFETTAVLDLIEREKIILRDSKEQATCKSSETNYSCWTGSETDEGIFVPSRATLGRLAALSRALRPYRYLNVEDAAPYRFVGQYQGVDECLGQIDSHLIDVASGLMTSLAYNLNEDKAYLLENVDELKRRIINNSITAVVRNDLSPVTDESISLFLSKIFQLVGMEEKSTRVTMNCSPTSPERGQLLISLHAARINISRVAAAGGDFRYADMPGAQLSNIVLKKVDLSYAYLPGATFKNANLEEVVFDGAHLEGTTFLGAELRKTSFDGALTQKYNDGASSVGLFSAKVAELNILNGLTFIEWSAEDQPSTYDRICLAASMVGRLDSKIPRLQEKSRNLPMMDEFKRFALLVQQSNRPEKTGKYRIVAKVVPASLESFTELVSKDSGLEHALYYYPFSSCYGWPSTQPAADT